MPTVSTNTAANTALRFLNFNSAQSGHSIAKLASGSRIVRASDDAAGLAISSRLSADTSILRQSSINAAQGVSVLQVADGGLARISDVLQRLAALGAQSLSGVPSDTERGFIDAEFQQLLSEIDGKTPITIGGVFEKGETRVIDVDGLRSIIGIRISHGGKGSYSVYARE